MNFEDLQLILKPQCTTLMKTYYKPIPA